MHAATFKPGPPGGAPGEWVQTIPQKEWYSAQDVAVILNIGTTQVYGSVNRATLQGYKVDGVVRIRHEDLVAYIERRETTGTAGEGTVVVERITATRPRFTGPQPVPSTGPGRVTAAIGRPALVSLDLTELEEVDEGDLPGGLDLDELDLEDSE